MGAPDSTNRRLEITETILSDHRRDFRGRTGKRLIFNADNRPTGFSNGLANGVDV